MSRETLRKRLEAATPGPWWSVTDAEPDPYAIYDHVWGADGDAVAQAFGNLAAADGVLAEDDAALIAHARQDLPALLELADAAADAVWFAPQHAPTDEPYVVMKASDCVRITKALAALEELP